MRENTMNDRELLEMAAKAIGFNLHVNSVGDYQLWKDGEYVGFWIPLEDDGDALRLAVKLKMTVDTNGWNYDQGEFSDTTFVSTTFEEQHKGDPYAATRRAIVRAAAEVGKLGVRQ